MSWLAALVIATMLATCAFMVVRITLFLLTEGQWYDRLAAAALLFAECFYFINCLGYFGNVFRVLTRPRGDVALPDDLPSGKPIGVFETSSAYLGGNKEEWIVSALDSARSLGLGALVWFQVDKEIDWRLETHVSEAVRSVIEKQNGSIPSGSRWLGGAGRQ